MKWLTQEFFNFSSSRFLSASTPIELLVYPKLLTILSVQYMTVSAYRALLEAFDGVERSVRLKEIYLGVLPELEVDLNSSELPLQLRPFDTNGSLTSPWKLLGPLRRDRVWRALQKWKGEGVPSLEIKQRLDTLFLSLQIPPPGSVVPAASVSGEPFPKAWLAADQSGRMQRQWSAFTESQRAQVRKFAKESVFRTGAEAKDELMSCFQRVKDLQQSEPSQRVSEAQPVSSSSSSSSSSSEEMETVTRSVTEVMNVRIDRKKDNKVMIEVKHGRGRDWVDASTLLAPPVLDRLRQALARVP